MNQFEEPKRGSSDSENRKVQPKQTAESPVKPRVVRLGTYNTFLAVCFALAGFLISVDKKFAVHAILLLFMALVLSAFAFRLWLINHHRTHKRANAWWCGVMVPSLTLCGYLLWWQSQAKEPAVSKPKSNLTLLLTSPHFPDFELPLTNKLLFDPAPTGSVSMFIVHNAKMMLAIPVTSNSASATLRIGVAGNPERNGEPFDVWVSVPEGLECALGKGWEDHGVRKGFRSLSTTSRALLSGQMLTDVGLKKTGGWSNPPPEQIVGILVLANGMPKETISLKLVCPVLESPEQPVLIPPDGQIRFNSPLVPP